MIIYIFIFLADGIYDNLTNKDIIKIIWTSLRKYNKKNKNKKEVTEKICNEIINKSVEMGSGDNLSVIFIAFDNFFNNSEKIDEILKKIENKNCDLMII